MRHRIPKDDVKNGTPSLAVTESGGCGQLSDDAGSSCTTGHLHGSVNRGPVGRAPIGPRTGHFINHRLWYLSHRKSELAAPSLLCNLKISISLERVQQDH